MYLINACVLEKKRIMELSKDIETYPGFCTKCGSILPLLSMEEFLKCYSCKTVFGPESMCNHYLFFS